MYYEEQETSIDNQLNLNDRNFRIAFSFEEKKAKKLKNDPRYVRWIFRIKGFKGDKEYEKILPYHECTDEDYAEFYPIKSG